MLERLQKASRVFVVGMGLTGLSCARFLYGRHVDFYCIDTQKTPAELQTVAKSFSDNRCYAGDEYKAIRFDCNDVLIVSPGIPLSHPMIQYARKQKASLTSDIDIFLDEVTCPVIAITGSNGKSTVVTLIAHILNSTNSKACLAGNIGNPVLDELTLSNQIDWFVLELSSFQLERLQTVDAAVAAILNVTEDHMDRYDNLGDYQKAKAKVFRGAKACVINADDALTEPPVAVPRALTFGLEHHADLSVKKKQQDEWIFYHDKPLLPLKNLKLKGLHNAMNVMAAMASCYFTGLDFTAMVEPVESFKGIRHRCQWVGCIDGVTYYNDSKATNTGASIAALKGLGGGDSNIILIAGGHGKNSDFAQMAEAVRHHVKCLILIGDEAKRMAENFDTPAIFANSLEAAISVGREKSQPGDIILLSPACASFDMFDNYQHRGDVFINVVERIAEESA